MSPELNGNPPAITKRKKNREKKHSSTSIINECNVPSYNSCFQNNLSSYPNLTLQESSAYYPFFNYPMPTEPMSLPVYPTHYQTYSYPSNPNLTYSGNYTGKIRFTNVLPSLSTDSNDYMSLPIVGTDQNDSGKRRFSDPGPNDSDSSSNSVESRIIRKLSEQINTLKECNRKLNREINDMRIELNMLKQQQQNSRHFDRDYEPGMIAEFIKEVRDAARVREDALIAKVKYMIEEKQLNMNPFQVTPEKSRCSDRISKLEEQMKNISMNHSRSEDNVSMPSSSATMEENGNSARQVIELEREALQLRRELQDARAKKEESDQKFHQLDKKLCHLLRRKDTTASETSEDGKTSTASAIDTYSVTTMSPGLPTTPQRVTLSGPVTDL